MWVRSFHVGSLFSPLTFSSSLPFLSKDTILSSLMLRYYNERMHVRVIFCSLHATVDLGQKIPAYESNLGFILSDEFILSQIGLRVVVSEDYQFVSMLPFNFHFRRPFLILSLIPGKPCLE